MGRIAVNVLARRVARRAWTTQRHFSKTAVSEQASGTGLSRTDAQVGHPECSACKAHPGHSVAAVRQRWSLIMTRKPGMVDTLGRRPAECAFGWRIADGWIVVDIQAAAKAVQAFKVVLACTAGSLFPSWTVTEHASDLI